MTEKDLFGMALGIQTPWFIDAINLDLDKGELHINVDFNKGSIFKYHDGNGIELGSFKAYDTSVKTWRHMNFFQYKCYLHARVPRVDIGEGKIRQIKTPWEGISSGFTLLFEALILQLVKVLPIHQVAKYVGTYDQKIWDMLANYTESCRELLDFSAVSKIGVDETAARRGHDYVSIFADMDAKNTLYVCEGKDSETVKKFADELESKGGSVENIKQVSCDMSPAFIKGVEENFPKAEITFDKFHILKIINQAVDKVRKEEVKTNPILKKTKYIFLKNKYNFTLKEKIKYNEICASKLNLKTFKAMQIRELFQQLYYCDSKENFEIMLDKWYFWATHSKINQIIDVAKTIKNHWNGIINWAESKINNGILEGFNSIFQAAKAKARGYKKTSTIATIIYILTAKLDFAKVNTFYCTHSVL